MTVGRDGSKVGFADGDCVEGVADGRNVGLTVGVAEGVTVGQLLGENDGVVVGFGEGMVDGTADG